MRFFALSFILVFAACTSKSIKQENANGALHGDNAITSEPMTFDPQGSDSQKIPGLFTIHFDFNKSALKESEKQNLQKDFDWMKTHPKITMQVEGHCDLRGSDEYNLALGERRARAIKDYLMTMGIPSDRISIISYGREKPLSRNESEADQAMNRRANFVPLKN